MKVSGNWDEFISDLNKEFIEDIIEPVNDAVEQSMLKGWVSAVSSTRVRTGRARFSWSLSVNGEGFTDVPAVPDTWYNHYGYPDYPEISFDLRNGDTIQLGNIVEYIDYLEEGSATISPPGFMLKNAITTIKRSLNVRLTNLRKRRK